MEQSTIREERVAFEVESVDVVGVLRVPLGARASAALVFAGPMTSVKEQATGNYAVAMAARGFVTLAFDHRHFGESQGQPPASISKTPARPTSFLPSETATSRCLLPKRSTTMAPRAAPCPTMSTP